MELRPKTCRFGKHCRHYLAGTCQFNHICKFGARCMYWDTPNGCKFVHPEIQGGHAQIPSQTTNTSLLKKWLISDINSLNMASLETILKKELSCSDLEDFLPLAKKILDSEKQGIITGLITVVKNTQVLKDENLKKLRVGFPAWTTAKNLKPVLVSLSTWIDCAHRLIMLHPS